MQKKAHKLLLFILFLLVFTALICGLLYFYLTGQPEPVSAEQISDALISLDLQPVDITETAQGNFPGAGLIDCIVAEQGDMRFEFYTLLCVRSRSQMPHPIAAVSRQIFS